ncbi:tetratricopeptide repeat protein [Clostridium estertheticum]|uniref:Uncharacterized protein n=1 Tax=Clostridium estertheticum subsp. estertheticum TaxID=1552 RepID=A0A1J0GD29_9CLOT|nr:tetratricopeptide repeat protein [Clostridium estertheticum]APC39258.1 hypothetical protein A7L45_03880 [Clostridium estertheticum subsp. estertheticum]MBU3071912.1 J domain-containing protein [Clostridium estertheticum]MBU3162004.1 J domain-containing protein [Clostridium estertheticum]MBZ9614742.1 J domain-containing protein [Clostridium estertheticum subsp. laramiense]WAG74663.1 J domain-containing protein [Clostridium estertheticum]
MKWWDVLKIPYDSDLKTIKRAYAKLLKVHNPENDAKGYQKLRESYDEAVKFAKRNGKYQNVQEGSYSKDDGNTSEKYLNEYIIPSQDLSTNISYEEKQADNINSNKEINDFFSRLNEIYNDISLRINLKSWKELLNFNGIWNAYSFEVIEERMFEFLINHKYLSSEVWSLLDNNFNWTNNEIKLYDKYHTDKVEEFFKNLRNSNNLKYDYLGSLNSDFADKYLYLRENGRELLYETGYKKDYYEIQKSLFSAYDIFKKDPELLRLIGTLYHDTGNFNKALEYLEQAFAINEYDLESALFIGGILGADGRFSEALPYLKLYLSFNKNQELALNNIGYCYYYTNNFMMAREIFKKYIEICGNNKRIAKCLKNIELKLEGKNVKIIRFKKYKPRKKKIAPKKIKKPVTKESVRKAKFIYTIILILLVSVVFALSFVFGNRNIKKDNTTKISNTTQSSNKESYKIFNDVKSAKEFKDLDFRTNVEVYLKNVKPIKYYKISESLDNKVIFSENQINEKKLWNKVESQLYLGEFDGVVIPFEDKNCSNKTIDKNGGYKVKGSKTWFDAEQSRQIHTKYSSFYDSKNSFVVGEYIDTSQIEINKAIRGAKLIKIRGNYEIKVLETAQDFKDTMYSGTQSVHLTNIIPLDLYFVKYNKNKSYGHFNKKAMDEKKLWDETYTQAYSGTVGELNIMFLDLNFSRNLIKSGGYTVEGFVYGIYDEFRSVKTEDGQNVDKVNLYCTYIDNTR